MIRALHEKPAQDFMSQEDADLIAAVDAQLEKLRGLLPALEGKANKKERTRVNKEIYALENGEAYICAMRAVRHADKASAADAPVQVMASAVTSSGTRAHATEWPPAIDAGSSSICGTHTPVNQDRACTVDLGAGACCVGVFDGHCQSGERAAEAAMQRLISCMPCPEKWWEDPDGIMQSLVAELQAAALAAHAQTEAPSEEADGRAVGAKRQLPAIDFGCTAAIAILVTGRAAGESMVVAGNLGDSPILLCGADSADSLRIERLSARRVRRERPLEPQALDGC